jgi:hypothetical protein
MRLQTDKGITYYAHSEIHSQNILLHKLDISIDLTALLMS